MLKRALVAVAVIFGCADPSGPTTHVHAQRMLIAGTEDGAVVVDLDWRGIIRRSGPRFVSQGPSALNGSGALITVGRIQGDATVMAGLDIDTGLELWRTSIGQGTTPAVVDGVSLGATIIAANPSRSEVFLSRSTQNGVGGIAGYDYERKRITRFFGPVGTRLRAMAATPATTAHPTGCLVMALDADLEPGPGLNIRAAFHVVCGTEYADRDSIAIALPSRQVLQMETSADGKDLIVMTDLELMRLDAATLEVELRATRPMVAPFFASRATGRLIIPDVGSSVVASTGIIYLLDANLELSSIIDLRVLPFGERPLGIMGAEESRDGKWLYIVGGVPRDGPLYGPEPTHILVIDKATGLVADTINLDTFGGARPILVP
ncbi:MAG TPA: hypothetical protein VF128_01830 [Gemmatimonadaceae bacterium]